MSEKVIVDGQEITFLEQDKNILNALERVGIESHYHCRDGFCGACRCKLISGNVEYPIDPLAFIGDGEILTCCSKPITDIEIDVHD
ncbi:ferredoxin [Colwellia chukchiensis]|uniref:Ferredoxin n=1 Tax=Colwellia chukchiensis TaxID=641665 RepID=A0A1H7NZ66_9GAMM|nr:class I ribonucleotide reductase maintenance protein YfaE [Colwellia chukchiensis]SEL28686.1 ferredoxin [Colwellia chukchiensis]